MSREDHAEARARIDRFLALQEVYDGRVARFDVARPLRGVHFHVQAKGGRLRAPLVVMLDLTNQCNIHCVFCYRAGPKVLLEPAGRVLHRDLDALAHLLDELKGMGVASVTLSGGEPTMHPRFIDAVELVKERDLSLTVVTNGTHLAQAQLVRLAARLDRRRDKIELSLHAATAETFAALTGSRRYDHLQRTLAALHDLDLPFLTMTLALRANLGEIDAILDLAAAHGAREHAVEAPFPKSHLSPAECLPVDEVLDLYARLLASRPGRPFLALNFFHLHDHIFRDLPSERAPATGGCHAGSSSCAIDILDNIHLCQFAIDHQGTAVGNLADAPLAELWARAQRRSASRAAESCTNCPAFVWEATRDEPHHAGQPLITIHRKGQR